MLQATVDFLSAQNGMRPCMDLGNRKTLSLVILVHNLNSYVFSYDVFPLFHTSDTSIQLILNTYDTKRRRIG